MTPPSFGHRSLLVLRPVPDAGYDEVHCRVVLTGRDGEGMPLQLGIVRHADEGIHPGVEFPEIWRRADLQLREGSIHAAVLAGRSGFFTTGRGDMAVSVNRSPFYGCL